MKVIKLTQSKSTIVDDKDFSYLSCYNWYYLRGYAVRKSSRKLGKQKMISMHSFIMNTPKGLYTDHVNGNKLDNRRTNLRICTSRQNSQNRKQIAKDNTSGYKGVHWSKKDKKWRAVICVNSRQIQLGHFTNKIEAAKAYNRAAKKYFKAFAKLNII